MIDFSVLALSLLFYHCNLQDINWVDIETGIPLPTNETAFICLFIYFPRLVYVLQPFLLYQLYFSFLFFSFCFFLFFYDISFSH